MKLNELLKNVEVLNILGDADIEITGVNIDSRRIEAGHLFVAIPGTQTDGHKFIPKAIEQGAVAVSVLWRSITPTEVGWCDRYER